jgi:hypothetical protein
MTLRHIVIVLVAALLTSCAGTTEPESTQVVFEAEMPTTTVVTFAAKKGADRIDGGFIDSVRIDKLRMMFTRIKLKRSSEDTVKGARDVKVGPTIVTFERGKPTVAVGATIPVGTYDRMKLEMRPLTPSEATQYANDNTFKPFIDPERVSVIVDGRKFASNSYADFTVSAEQTEDVWIVFDEPITVKSETTEFISLLADATPFFLVDGAVLEPGDGRVKLRIKQAIRSMFRARKK